MIGVYHRRGGHRRCPWVPVTVVRSVELPLGAGLTVLDIVSSVDGICQVVWTVYFGLVHRSGIPRLKVSRQATLRGRMSHLVGTLAVYDA